MSSLLDEVRTRPKLPAPGMAKAIRRAAGVTQARLAAELDVHPVTLSRWETGVRKPQGMDLTRWMAMLAELAEATK